MGTVLQKKKARSTAPKRKQRANGKRKNGNKKVNVLGNAIIAENWDKSLTLTQNYRRLGLLHRLNAPAGGSEKRATSDGVEQQPGHSLQIQGSATAAAKKAGLGEIRVERDVEGNIIRVIRDEDEMEVAGHKRSRTNPLNDPLNDLSDNETPDLKNQSAIVQQLELQADAEGDKVKSKKPRHQSSREAEWITRLIEKHGDNIKAMVRDRKLNPMQQSEGDIARRIRKFQKSQS